MRKFLKGPIKVPKNVIEKRLESETIMKQVSKYNEQGCYAKVPKKVIENWLDSTFAMKQVFEYNRRTGVKSE